MWAFDVLLLNTETFEVVFLEKRVHVQSWDFILLTM